MTTPQRLIYSYPKTGRTWLRFMVAGAMVSAAGIDYEIDLQSVYSVIPNDQLPDLNRGPTAFEFTGRLPLVMMSHKHARPHRDGFSIVLVRNPFDVMVSHWLHAKHHYSQPIGDLPEFIRSRQGIRNYCDFLERSAEATPVDKVFTYEQIHQDPAEALRRALLSLSLPAEPRSIQAGVEVGNFNRMRAVEIKRGIRNHSYDRSNPDALRVRRGIVGGHRDYLTDSDRSFIEDHVAAMSRPAIALLGGMSTVA